MHLACAVPNVDWGVSLTNFYLAEDIVRRPIAIADGMVACPMDRAGVAGLAAALAA